ncbi:hypothetical protein WJS89_10450 [Sphingomicrobium sp. XHP0235]
MEKTKFRPLPRQIGPIAARLIDEASGIRTKRVFAILKRRRK